MTSLRGGLKAVKNSRQVSVPLLSIGRKAYWSMRWQWTSTLEACAKGGKASVRSALDAQKQITSLGLGLTASDAPSE